MIYKSIAIDGPSGAGKSTLAKRLADELSFLYMDTGAIYRTIGLFAAQNRIDIDGAEKIAGKLDDIRMNLRHESDGIQHMYLDGKDVTALIREREAARYASVVSAIPEVRAFLLQIQRDFAKENHVVMDGRDIGTVILPYADVKIFLTASAEARARRRHLEFRQNNIEIDYETVFSDIIKRDEKDRSRTSAPLRMAEDACLLDTTHMTLDESYRALYALVKKGLAE